MADAPDLPPLPVVDAESAPFWDALRARRLVLPRCASCGSWFFYPRALCPACHSSEIHWGEAAGTGVIYSFTVSRRPASPAFAGRVPYVVALVDLDEGVRMMSTIDTDDVTAVRIGARVRVAFDEVTPDVTLPRFVLADRGDG